MEEFRQWRWYLRVAAGVLSDWRVWYEAFWWSLVRVVACLVLVTFGIACGVDAMAVLYGLPEQPVLGWACGLFWSPVPFLLLLASFVLVRVVALACWWFV